MQKDFDKWNEFKKVTELRKDGFGVHEREVWWVSLGLNIGVEIDGKHGEFERPVLVIKKFNRQMVWVVPTTSQLKDLRFHEKFLFQNREYFAAVTQLRTISTKRFLRKAWTISNNDFDMIIRRIVRILQTNEDPLVSGSSRRPKP